MENIGTMESMLIFISTLLANMIMSIVFEAYCKKSKKSNEVLTKYLGRFVYFKFVIHIACMFTLSLFLSTFRINALKILTPLYLIFLFLLDSSLLYKTSMRIGGSTLSFQRYMRLSFVEVLILFLPLTLVVTSKALSGPGFMFRDYIPLIVFAGGMIVLPYLARFRYIGCKITDVYRPDEFKSKKYKIYVHDNSETKETNAYVYGVIPPYHLYISKDIIDELTKDEFFSVLYHELAHIKEFHLVIRGLYLLGVYFVMTSIGTIFDRYIPNIPIPLGISILILAFIYFIGILNMQLVRYQEYRADSFAARKMGCGEPLISGLTKIMDKQPKTGKSNFIKRLFASHPPLEKRIQNIEKIMETQRKEI